MLPLSPSRTWPVVTAALPALAIVACLLALVRPADAVLLVAAAVWFTGPGVAIVAGVHGRAAGMSWLLAPVLGYVASSFVTLVFWAGGARGAWILAAAPVVAAATGWGGATLLRGRLEAPAFTRRDALALALVVLLVPATVGRPYARVGDNPPGHPLGGQAYRAYFTADVVWAMAAVSEVSKGDFPPKNPFRLGASMHYYWMAHLYPAIEHRALPDIPLRSLLLANAVLSGVAFVAFLYCFARHFTARAWAAAAGVAWALWATSFEGIEQLAALWQADRPLSLVRYVNIDAITRWVHHGMPVDGLQRLLLYQPQHQMGYAVAFVGLLLVLQARRAAQVGLGAVVGATLGAALLLSTFSAFMMTAIVAVVLGWRLLRERAWLGAIRVALAAAVPLACAVWLALSLEYVERSEGAMVSLMWNDLAFHRWPFALWLSMGPVWVVSAVLLATRLARRRTVAFAPWPLAVVVAVAMAFYFFVDVRDHEHVYVGWRSGHLIFIALAAIVATTADSLARLSTAWRLSAAVVLAATALAALPTTAIDLYNTQDITNFDMASTFHWTTWLSPDEVEGLDWLRTRTPVGAIVQMDTRAHGTETWAYLPAFGERRMAAGVPISMIPLRRYLTANARVIQVFDAQTADEAADLATRNGIDYLWLGPGEQARRPSLLPMLAHRPDRCVVAFRNATVAVVQCR